MMGLVAQGKEQDLHALMLGWSEPDMASSPHEASEQRQTAKAQVLLKRLYLESGVLQPEAAAEQTAQQPRNRQSRLR